MAMIAIILGLALYVVLFFVLPKLVLLLAPFVVLFAVLKMWSWSRIGAISLALALGGVPALWIFMSVSQFKAACASVPRVQISAKPTLQKGFLLDAGSVGKLATQKFISPDTFLEKGGFSYVEQPVWNPEYAQAHNLKMKYTRRYNDRVENVSEPSSEYIFATQIAARGAYGAPLYEVQHSIRRRSDGSTVATATDIVFGGGIIGSYLALAGGYATEDQDSVLVSCGYSDSDVGAWRPNNNSEPRWAKYKEADLRFLSSVLKERG